MPIPDPPEYSLSTNLGRGEIVDGPLTSQGPYTLRARNVRTKIQPIKYQYISLSTNHVRACSVTGDEGTAFQANGCDLIIHFHKLVERFAFNLNVRRYIQEEPQLKLAWIRDACLLVDPRDTMLSQHMRPILESVFTGLHEAGPHTSVLLS
jgi:hypothetical protein